jgi:hypothetical protein
MKTMKNWLLTGLLFMIVSTVFSQVTNSSISGTVKSSNGERLPGATVEAIHKPTGSKYFATTDGKGSYAIPSIRPGGPYTIKVTTFGYKASEITDINAPLGNNITVNAEMENEVNALQEVVIKKSSASGVFSKGKTGASTQFSERQIAAIPVLGSRSINSVTKYSAYAGSNGSFGGQDSRANNFTIDGSVFNNGFGLGSDTQAGGRTGSTAISLDAIEQLQVNIAPYDVRQSGFTGSGINAVTRSGTNEIEGSAYHSFRSYKKNFIGTEAGDVTVKPGIFDEKIYGARLGAPIIKNKLFFFGNFETIEGTRPATIWTSTGSPNPSAQVSLPTYTQMADLSKLMFDKFGYVTGPWENFNSVSESTKFLARLDWNVNDNHKVSLRYVQHDSSSDQLISNSNSAGIGNRTAQANAMSFKNSGYVIEDNTKSIVLEINSKFSDKWSNTFIGGYDLQEENRGLQGGGIFPTIDIRNGSPTAATLISVGLDPFTKGNLLDYSTLHFTDNVTGRFGKHTFVFGANYERFISNNLFYPASNGVYVFDSLADFTAAATTSAANGNKPSLTNLPSRFQFRYSALPGGEDPIQVLKYNKFDLYAQDEIKVNDNLRITAGLRATMVTFEDTALENPLVNTLTFANGEKFNTGLMPKTQVVFEPRVGFNLDVTGDATTQVRGGSGIFTGRPPGVFLSNAIGNNGVLTGFIDRSGAAIATGGYGFTPNPQDYFTPDVATLPTEVDLAFTDRNFKFPQSWKTNIAVDQKLLFGFVGTIEGLFSKNINAMYYYNANLDKPTGVFAGTDTRPRYAGNDNGVRVNDNVSNAIVLANTNEGYFYSTTFKLEYPYKNGIWGSLAYTRSGATDLMSAGSTAAGSWTNARSINGNNDLSLSTADNATPHRIVGVLGYKINYGKKYGGSTSFNLGYIGEQAGGFSYTYNGDMNGDRISLNDLIYIPKSASEIRFEPITGTVNNVPNQVIYTEAQQQKAFDDYINQDSYLSGRRGQYAERNAHVLPMLHRLDLSVTQDLFVKIAGKNNNFQIRADILNFTNLLNKDWGVSQRVTNRNVLNYRNTKADVPFYQLATQTDADGNRFLIKDTFQKNASVFDVWQAQISLRYIFGK